LPVLPDTASVLITAQHPSASGVAVVTNAEAETITEAAEGDTTFAAMVILNNPIAETMEADIDHAPQFMVLYVPQDPLSITLTSFSPLAGQLYPITGASYALLTEGDGTFKLSTSLTGNTTIAHPTTVGSFVATYPGIGATTAPMPTDDAVGKITFKLSGTAIT